MKHFFHYLVVNLFFGNDIEKNTERSVVDILFIIYKMYVLDEIKIKEKYALFDKYSLFIKFPGKK